MKKYIIAGGRDFETTENFDYMVECITPILYDDEIRGVEFISGGANGADKLGEMFYKLASATKRLGQIPQKLSIFNADWNTYGKSAGPIRNEQMAKYADACIVFWDGKSKGAKNMIDNAIKHRLELHIFFY